MPKIKCPSCCDCYHETTENFNPDVQPNGSMVRLMEPWRGWGWSPFGDDDDRDIEFAETAATLSSDLICPGCGSPLAPDGRLIVLFPDKSLSERNQEAINAAFTEEPFACGICGKVCKTQLGMYSHMKVHKKPVIQEIAQENV